jgi:transposase-like protein
LIVPLNALDVEVRDFSNFAPFEDKPIRFNALVNAAKVPVPTKIESKPTESRELFAQASANGMIGLYPTPHGWIKTSVSGLELAALKGAANEAGVTLTGGVFDSTADAKLPGDNTIRTTSKFTFTDLSLSEPPNGPIFKLLHLPAPLDVVIGALQDQEGSITVPIDMSVKSGKLSASDLVGPAVGAFGSIVVTAIASAPLKAAGGLTDMLGLGGNKKHTPELPIILGFEPGYTGLSAVDQAALSALAQRMNKDKSLTLVIHHDLGGGDLTVANERANPSQQDAKNLAEQLRQQQMETLQQRSALAGTARAELAWGSTSAASTTIEQLRALDQQVAENDDALDRLYGMLRPGADRQAARRTRGACLEYGHERLEAVKHALIAAGLTDMDRVHLASPQFAQVPGDAGGTVVVTLVPKKKG